MSTTIEHDMAEKPTRGRASVKVWDPLVRVFHWSLAITFTAAYITGDEWDNLHYIIGYVIIGLIAFRLVWGFVGPHHARFWHFIYRPATVFAFLRDSVSLKAKRYIGHNPAGGAMVVALLVLLALQTATGYSMTVESLDRAMPWLEDVHGALANVILALVILHVIGVVVASIEHKENLARSMVTGRKRSE